MNLSKHAGHQSEEFKPFPVGAVRGPFRTSPRTVCYMVQGPGGWVPITRPEKYPGESEVECEKAAKEYAATILSR